MTQTTNAILSFIVFVIFCHILCDQHFVSGQAYHFSKGWMPGKRTNILLEPGQFGGAQTLDGLSQAEDAGQADDYDQQQRFNMIEDMITETTANEENNNDLDSEEDNNMARLRTLLRTLPRIQRLSAPQSSVLPSSSSHSHTPPKCQIRPHLTRLIETLLDVSISVCMLLHVIKTYTELFKLKHWFFPILRDSCLLLKLLAVH